MPILVDLYLTMRRLVFDIRSSFATPVITMLFLLSIYIQISFAQDHPSLSAKIRVAKVKQAIELLGGDRWDSLKAATVNATISHDGGQVRSETWAYDWNQPMLRQHRQRLATKDSAGTNADAQSNQKKKSNAEIYRPQEYDLVTLASAFPGSALKMATERKECRIVAPTSKETAGFSSKFDLSYLCNTPLFPGGHLSIIWRFDSKGFPAEVLIPLLAVGGHEVHYASVRFLSFQSADGVLVSKEVDLSGAGPVKHISFDSPGLKQSLPEDVFASR